MGRARHRAACLCPPGGSASGTTAGQPAKCTVENTAQRTGYGTSLAKDHASLFACSWRDCSLQSTSVCSHGAGPTAASGRRIRDGEGRKETYARFTYLHFVLEALGVWILHSLLSPLPSGGQAWEPRFLRGPGAPVAPRAPSVRSSTSLLLCETGESWRRGWSPWKGREGLSVTGSPQAHPRPPEPAVLT